MTIISTERRGAVLTRSMTLGLTLGTRQRTENPDTLPWLLLEDGSDFLLEDGSRLLLDAPAFTSAPTISGTITPGGTATVSWSAPGYSIVSYQWQVDGVDIPGATSATYEIDPGDMAEHVGDDLTCVVTVTDGEDEQSTTSVGAELVWLPWDMIWIGGQSNASGAGAGLDATGLDAPSDVIFQWFTKVNDVGTGASHAVEYIQNAGGGTDGVGFSLSLAKAHVAEEMAPGRQVMIVNCGYSATNLHTSWLGFGSDLLANVTRRINEVEAVAPPGSQWVGAVWAQGESDAVGGRTQAEYTADMGTLLTFLRATALGDTPLVILSMVPKWVAVNSARQAIDAAHQAIPALHTFTTYLEGDDSNPTVDIHYTAAQQRLNGAAIQAAFATAAAND